jgi:hypothetical protein
LKKHLCCICNELLDASVKNDVCYECYLTNVCPIVIKTNKTTCEKEYKIIKKQYPIEHISYSQFMTNIVAIVL